MINIRLANEQDIPMLGDIERNADKIFVDYGYPIGDGATQPHDLLQQACKEQRLWVVEQNNSLVGFALVLILDGHAHLEQISVISQSQKNGLGSKLIDTVIEWAKDRGFDHVNLSTTTDVPWNMPFYEKKGFETLSEEDLDEYMYKLRESELAHGLDLNKRAFMRYVVNTDRIR